MRGMWSRISRVGNSGNMSAKQINHPVLVIEPAGFCGDNRAQVRYLARGVGSTVYFTDDEVVISLKKSQGQAHGN